MGLVGCEASELFLYVWLWLLCQGTVQDGLSGCAKEPVLHGKTVPFTVQKALFCFSGAWGLLPSMVLRGFHCAYGQLPVSGFRVHTFRAHTYTNKPKFSCLAAIFFVTLCFVW